MKRDPFTKKVIGCALEDLRALGKVVDEVKGINKAQLLTYMKVAQIKAGLLINFNVRRLADGIQRFKLSFLCGLCVLCGEYLT